MSTVATLGVDDVATHAAMLLDPVRMAAYAEAIARVVRPGDVVVDAGAGSGILSVLAAKAGARRVFAVERGPVATLARRVVAENGLDGVVEIVRGDARDVILAEPVGVIMSELLGSFGVDEQLLALHARLASQAAPGPRSIPARLSPTVALIEDRALARELAALRSVQGVRLASLIPSLTQRVLQCRLREGDVVSAPVAVGTYAPGHDALPRVLTAALKASRSAEVNAIGGWFSAELCEGVALLSGPFDPPTHWGQLMLPLDPPLVCREGDEVRVEITPRVVGSRSLWAWQARAGEQVRRGDAFSSLLGDARDVSEQLGAGAWSSAMVKRRLEAFRAALAGDGPLSPEAMAARLLKTMPGRYVDESDAMQDVWALLSAARSPGA